MNKKLIAIAVGAALAAPMAAQADVTIYGKAQIELSNIKVETPTTSTTTRNLNDDRKMGRIGVNATEDLGNGMTGLAHMGYIMATGTSNGLATTRQSYVGIAGGFGTVRFGRLAGAYKDMNLDPYIATVLEARSGGGNSAGAYGHNGFINDVIKYNNKFGNLKFEALATAGNAQNGDNGNFQLAGDYRSGPLRVILAYSKHKDPLGTGTSQDEKRTTVGVQYAVGPGKLTGQIEKVKNYTPSTVDYGDVDFYMLSYDANLGNMNSLYVRWGQEKYKTGVSSKNKSYMVAVKHMMSKTFRVWGGYFQTKNDSAGTKTTALALGMRKDF